MFFRSRRRWLASMALLVAGCLSPTLPLPPPGDPTVSSTDTQGLVRLTGHVPAESEVYALNRSTNLIFGEYTESGDYDFTMEARDADRVSLWYVTGSTESPPNDFVIRLPKAEPAP